MMSNTMGRLGSNFTKMARGLQAKPGARAREAKSNATTGAQEGAENGSRKSTPTHSHGTNRWESSSESESEYSGDELSDGEREDHEGEEEESEKEEEWHWGVPFKLKCKRLTVRDVHLYAADFLQQNAERVKDSTKKKKVTLTNPNSSANPNSIPIGNPNPTPNCDSNPYRNPRW